MICTSPNRPFFIQHLLGYLVEQIQPLNTVNFRRDYDTRENLVL